MARFTDAYIQPGETMTLAAPYDRTGGQGAKVGAFFGVAKGDVLETVEGEFQMVGVFELAKLSTDEWAVGDKVYWDDTNKRCDTDPTVGMLIGVAAEVCANPTTTGAVRLNGTAPAISEGTQAAIADLTFGANITAATANGALTDSSATNPTEAQFNELAKELGVKINAILATLRLNGLITP